MAQSYKLHFVVASQFWDISTYFWKQWLRGPLCISNLIIYGLQSVPSFPSSRASVERTRHCLVGSRLRAVFQCNFPAERVRQEATEWSDEGSWPLV